MNKKEYSVGKLISVLRVYDTLLRNQDILSLFLFLMLFLGT